MATTNGTRALAALAGWPVVLAACLNNVSAVQRAIRAHAPREVLLAAAGDENDWSAEDALCAGMIIRRLVAAAARTHEPVTLDPQARIAWSLAQRFGAKNLHRFLGETPHGQTLLRFGFKDDLRFCARLDTSRRVGRLDPEGWIRPG